MGAAVGSADASRPATISYGYGWWISKGLAGPSYNAVGSGGQRITIDPALNLVVVTTGGGFEFDEVVPYLVAAFVDLKKPLPANPEGDARLAEVLAACRSRPSPQPAVAAARHGREDLRQGLSTSIPTRSCWKACAWISTTRPRRPSNSASRMGGRLRPPRWDWTVSTG